jgi:hypothetical protein
MSDKENVIKFPVEHVLQKRAREEIDQIKKLAAKKQAMVIDGICKEVADSLYEVLVELDYASDDTDFFKDFTYTMEAFRSMLLRASYIKHPIQERADELTIRKKPKKD